MELICYIKSPTLSNERKKVATRIWRPRANRAKRAPIRSKWRSRAPDGSAHLLLHNISKKIKKIVTFHYELCLFYNLFGPDTLSGPPIAWPGSAKRLKLVTFTLRPCISPTAVSKLTFDWFWGALWLVCGIILFIFIWPIDFDGGGAFLGAKPVRLPRSANGSTLGAVEGGAVWSLNKNCYFYFIKVILYVDYE